MNWRTVCLAATMAWTITLVHGRALAATYYVATTGNDANAGTQAQPWQTPGHASKQLKPGDTLTILPGAYVLSRFHDDMITPEVSGKPDAWITIRGSDEKDRPILQGKANLLAAVDVGKRSYIRLENLEITSLLDNPYSGGLREGIEAGGSSEAADVTSFIAVRNVSIHHVEEAALNVGGNAADLLLESLDIHHTGFGGIASGNPEGGEGWQNVVVRDTRVHHAGFFRQGRELAPEAAGEDRPAGLGIETSEGPVEIARCRFEHCRGDGVNSKSKRTYLHDTVIANNRGDCLRLSGDGTRVENVLIYGNGDRDPENGSASIAIDTEQPGRFELVNVTVDENPERDNYPIYVQYDGRAAITVAMRNCIVAHGSRLAHFGKSVTLSLNHCLFFRRGGEAETVIEANGREYPQAELSALGPGNLSADPLFVRRAWGTEGDYHLQPGSPAVDAGSPDGPPTADLEGKPRPAGRRVDMGAYER